MGSRRCGLLQVVRRQKGQDKDKSFSHLRRPGPNRQGVRVDAEHRFNGIPHNSGFRNQQVSGSSPKGGSSASITRPGVLVQPDVGRREFAA